MMQHSCSLYGRRALLVITSSTQVDEAFLLQLLLRIAELWR